MSQNSENRKMGLVFRTLMWGCCLAALFFAGLYFYEQKGVRKPVASRSFQAFKTVKLGSIENNVTASGRITPITDVEVGAQVSGQVKVIHVVIGQHVEEGDLIAEIDSVPVEKKIEINEADLAISRAHLKNKIVQVALKQAQLTRQQTLLKGGGPTSQTKLDEAAGELASAIADMDALKATIRKQETQLQSSRVDLNYTKIYAPMSGTIVSVPFKKGQTLNSTQSTPVIAMIADLSNMTVQAQVSEADIRNLSVGMEVYFTLLGAPNKRYKSTLKAIYPMPETENNVVLYNALFDIPNESGALMIDMSAQVFFVEERVSNVLTIPLSVLKGRGIPKSPNAFEVPVLSNLGAKEMRKIITGVRNRAYVEVKSGLAKGEKVLMPVAPKAARNPFSLRK